MKIRFLGAVQGVTGSRHLVETNQTRILIDCGLYQERQFQSRNWEKFSVDPSTISHVVLTHGHVDHCGYLPKLVREGFKGKIVCTPPTAEIARIVLADSGRLQEADARNKNKRHKRENRKPPFPVVPLFTEAEANAVNPLFETVTYGKSIKISDDVSLVLHNAGHILGAAAVELTIKDEGCSKTIVFSGDIGRWDRPILCDPVLLKEADAVVMETTYGDRSHPSADNTVEEFLNIVKKTSQGGGKLIIPCFAIERAQEILYHLNAFVFRQQWAPCLVFIDSPMAIDVINVFNRYTQYFDKEARLILKVDDNLFSFSGVKACVTSEDSKAINSRKGPMIILAGSGMCTGGRIKHHLKHGIGDPQNMVLFVGYQAEGTLGRQILGRPKEVRILGEICKVRARIERLEGFSAHAGQDELLKWINSFSPSPCKIFLVHGEPSATCSFGDCLHSQNTKRQIVIPHYLEEYEI